MEDSSAQAEYALRRAESQEVEHRFDGWSALFGNGRVVVVVVGLVLAAAAYGQHRSQPRAWLIALAVLAFATLIVQGVFDKRRRMAHLRTLFYERGLARLRGEWRQFKSTGSRFQDAAHPYATDLDVIGDGSLFQLLDTTRTSQGEATLARWLLHPVPREEILARQVAVKALAPALDVRESLALAGADEELSRIDEQPLIAWAEGPALFQLHPALVWTSRILPFVSVGMYFLVTSDLVPWPVLVALGVAHLALLRHIHDGVAKLGPVAEHSERMLSRLVPVIDASRSLPVDSPRLRALIDRLEGAREAIDALKRRVTFFQSRANLIVAALSPIVFWDIHGALLLQSWQRSTGTRLRTWFEAVGELEAFAAAGTYAYEHPTDIWPEIEPTGASFSAVALGHPLLPTEHCVRNDLALSRAGTAILVTGSNMSGKSTLLRAVGLNAVLALAGLPVRASSLKLSVVQVATVMRVSDSLQEGASFFLAEVKRLKSVVDLAGRELPLLFLLDEILQGTNTRERSLGAKGVVAHLLKEGAFGLVSTHDLSLVQLGDAFGDRLQFAHFTDQVEGGQMTFDYRLKPGVVQTSNALRLMRAVGLEVDVPTAT